MANKSEVEVITLASGLKIACRRAPRAAVEYCGIVVRAGSRDDGQWPGLAHFVEHTLFKGTEKRSAWHIINRMERVGGELNAYTTKEETVVYTAAPSGNLTRAMELLADLACQSRFPDSEIEKEREVVCDEINSYLDTPSEAVFDDFEDLMYQGTPLGHNILGTVPSVRNLGTQQCRDYLKSWYAADNLVVFYLGNAGSDRVARTVERYFSALPLKSAQHASLLPGFNGHYFDNKRQLDLHQHHTVLGALVSGMYSPMRHAMALLTNILGGPGMNSMLNVALREKRGLVYSVEAATGFYTDCGLFTIYYGCDSDDAELCESLVRKQIQQIADHGVSDIALARAKKQYLGQLAVSSDNRESLAISTGRGILYYGRILTSKEVENEIHSISNDQLRQCANDISNLSSLTFK